MGGVGEVRTEDIGTLRYLDYLARCLEEEGYMEVAAPSCPVA